MKCFILLTTLTAILHTALSTPLEETTVNSDVTVDKNEISEPKPNSIEEDSIPALSDKVAKVYKKLNLSTSSLNYGDKTLKGIEVTDAETANSGYSSHGHPGYPNTEYGPGPTDIGHFKHHSPPTSGYDYGINELLGHGGLKIAGGSKENIFSQLVRLLLAIPTFKLSVLQPVILGFANTAAHVAHGAADVTLRASQHVPVVADVKADILRNLIGSFGQVTGSVLYVLAQLISSASSATIGFTANTLPHIFNSVGHAGHGVASTVGTFAQGIADTIQMIIAGVIEAVKTKSNFVTRIVEGGHELKSGVIKGVLHVDKPSKSPPPPPAVVYGSPVVGLHHG